MFTSSCKYCHKEFKVTNKKLHCCNTCKKNGSKSLCLICGKEFSHHGEKVLCSVKCIKKYFDIDSLSKKKCKKRKCTACGNKFKSNRDYCSLACLHGIKASPLKKVKGSKKNTFWDIVKSGIASGSKIVKKPWGMEIHIANNNHYCLKYLIFLKDRQFSFHMHNLKQELWHCVCGKFECVLGKEHLWFNCGDKIEIAPKVLHQLQALENSILVEVSTRDYPEDSIRIINGAN